MAGDDDLLRALKKSPSGPAMPSPAVIGAMQRVLGNRSAARAVQRLAPPHQSSIPTVQRWREADTVDSSKTYANGGLKIDGDDDSYHYSVNPKGPASPIPNHFDEIHVTFEKNSRDQLLREDSRPKFYYSDEESPKYKTGMEDTGANQLFREDHEVVNEGGNDGGWQEWAKLQNRSKKLAANLAPTLPEYEGKSQPEVLALHKERARIAAEKADAQKLADEAAAAEKLADSEAEKAGKKRLRVVYENSRHKKTNVESYAEQLKTKTGAIAASGNKAQGRGASACTVTLEFGDFKAAKAAITTIGTVKEPGNAEPLTVTIV